jgi:hypothetical protein
VPVHMRKASRPVARRGIALIRVPWIVVSTLRVALAGLILTLPRLVAWILILLIVFVVVVAVAALSLLSLAFILLFLTIGWLGPGFTFTFTTAAAGAVVFVTALTFIAAARLADTDSLLLITFLQRGLPQELLLFKVDSLSLVWS